MASTVRTVRSTVQVAVGAAVLALLVLVWPQSFGGKMAYVKVDGHSMDPTFHLGDLALVARQSSYRVGDAVAYRIPDGEFGAGAMVIHRLVGGDGVRGYVTKGDNRSIADEWHPTDADIVGRVRFDIPAAGNAVGELTKPMDVGGLVAGLTVLVMVIPSRGRRGSKRARYRGTRRLAPGRSD